MEFKTGDVVRVFGRASTNRKGAELLEKELTVTKASRQYVWTDDGSCWMQWANGGYNMEAAGTHGDYQPYLKIIRIE